MRLILTTILIVLPFQSVLAAELGWKSKALKQAEPNELAYRLAVDDECPIGRERAVSIVEGVMVRSRIKPLGGTAWITSKLHLSVLVSCMKLDGYSPVYATDIHFGNYSGKIPVFYISSFGGIGIGGSSFFESELKKHVEGAMTAYLKANFDLGD
jgi:hypothetical protein